MGIPWLKKFWSFCTLGRHGWRKNFPAAEGGRQIFWVVPWEFDPQMIFFACPCMIRLQALQIQVKNALLSIKEVQGPKPNQSLPKKCYKIVTI